MLTRALGFIYGVLCYVIFLATFLYAIGFVGGGNLYGAGKPLVVPTSIDLTISRHGEPFALRLAIDALLLALFAVQHSVMARQWFKRRWTQIVTPMLERSTYVLIASSILLVIFWQWRPLGLERVAWDVQNPTGRVALQVLFWLGWLMVLISTFLIDHFELFGLTQAIHYLKGTEPKAHAFKTPGPYKAVRHPLYLGFIIAFWSTPRMSMGHLFFAVMTTAYILVAIQFEERDMIRAYGEKYANYRKHVSMLLPLRIWKGESDAATPEAKTRSTGA